MNTTPARESDHVDTAEYSASYFAESTGAALIYATLLLGSVLARVLAPALLALFAFKLATFSPGLPSTDHPVAYGIVGALWTLAAVVLVYGIVSMQKAIRRFETLEVQAKFKELWAEFKAWRIARS